MNQKYQYYIVAILMIVGIVLVSKTDKNESWDKVLKVISEKEFHGVVVKKYIDNENHNDPIAILSTKQKINLWDFYGNVNIGDSLSKTKGTTIMTVYGNDKIQKLDFKAEIERRKSK